jgi:uncharacterized membrane protein
MAVAPQPWIKWALVASLGLNLAALGVIGGALIKGPPPPAPGFALWHYARALPDPYRHDLGAALRAKSGDWLDRREGLREARAAMSVALTADPFQPEAVAAALARQTTITDELAARGGELLIEQIGRMSPEERAAYAEALKTDRRHGPDRDRRRP